MVKNRIRFIFPGMFPRNYLSISLIERRFSHWSKYMNELYVNTITFHAFLTVQLDDISKFYMDFFISSQEKVCLDKKKKKVKESIWIF